MSDQNALREPIVAPWRLWLGVAAPPIAWAAHGLSCFVLSITLCRELESALVRPIVGVITAAALAVGIVSTLVAASTLRALRREIGGSKEGFGREEMLAIAGVFVGATLTLGVLMQGLPSLLIDDPCQVFR